MLLTSVTRVYAYLDQLGLFGYFTIFTYEGQFCKCTSIFFLYLYKSKATSVALIYSWPMLGLAKKTESEEPKRIWSKKVVLNPNRNWLNIQTGSKFWYQKNRNRTGTEVFRVGMGIRVFESGSGRVFSGPGPSGPSNLDHIGTYNFSGRFRVGSCRVRVGSGL